MVRHLPSEGIVRESVEHIVSENDNRIQWFVCGRKLSLGCLKLNFQLFFSVKESEIDNAGLQELLHSTVILAEVQVLLREVRHHQHVWWSRRGCWPEILHVFQELITAL